MKSPLTAGCTGGLGEIWRRRHAGALFRKSIANIPRSLFGEGGRRESDLRAYHGQRARSLSSLSLSASHSLAGGEEREKESRIYSACLALRVLLLLSSRSSFQAQAQMRATGGPDAEKISPSAARPIDRGAGLPPPPPAITPRSDPRLLGAGGSAREKKLLLLLSLLQAPARPRPRSSAREESIHPHTARPCPRAEPQEGPQK